MIVIDMDMPKSCEECRFFDGEDMCYADGTFALSQSAFENRPTWCPIKCDIEDIKTDIEETIESYVCDKEENTMKAQGMLNAMRMMFEIIDKHISGKEQNESKTDS